MMMGSLMTSIDLFFALSVTVAQDEELERPIAADSPNVNPGTILSSGQIRQRFPIAIPWRRAGLDVGIFQENGAIAEVFVLGRPLNRHVAHIGPGAGPDAELHRRCNRIHFDGKPRRIARPWIGIAEADAIAQYHDKAIEPVSVRVEDARDVGRGGHGIAGRHIARKRPIELLRAFPNAALRRA